MRELKAIPEYRALFDKAYGGKDGEASTFKNITYAIAAFQRTLSVSTRALTATRQATAARLARKRSAD